MKTTTRQAGRREARASLSSMPLVIRPSKRTERKRFDEQMGKYHYLGEGLPAGDTMRLIAEVDGQWVGLLMWGSAAYRLKDRDQFIGWTATQRALRQKLVVQNRRFCLLCKRGKHPNLASRILGASIKALPRLWFESFGYEPLLAETFTDMEAYEGTCYKAAGWEALGRTKGFSRHAADFYVPNDRPKKIWVKELRKGGAEVLSSMQLPSECLAGAQSDADGVLPLNVSQQESLHEALSHVPDPRARNTTFHIGAILSIVAMGVFSGYINLAQIVRFAQRLRNDQRQRLGLPKFASDSSYRKVPSYKVFYNLLSKLDLDEFASCLTQWLSAHAGTLPRALALDGKFIRNTVGLVCLVDHETGAPQAMTYASQKEGDGQHCELKAGQRLIEQLPDLTNALVTTDALHCQSRMSQQIVERGGEFIIQAKDNRKSSHKAAADLTKSLPPFLPSAQKGMAE